MPIEYYVKLIQEDSIRFMQLYNVLDKNIEFNKILLFKSLPLKNSSNIYGEVGSIADYLGVKIDHYWQLMFYMLRNYYSQEELYSLMSFLINNKIDFHEIYIRDWRFGSNRSKYDNEQQTYADCILNFNNEHNDKKRMNAIGNTGEYIVNNYLESLPNRENIWVSKDVGDGFGYDFISRDLKGQKDDIIEVKTFPGEYGQVMYKKTLSKNEASILKVIDSRPTREVSHVFFVPIILNDNKINYDIIDCYYNNGILNSYSFYEDIVLTVTPFPENKYKEYTLIKK